MNRERWLVYVSLLSLVPACTDRIDNLVLSRVEPSTATNEDDTPVAIIGDNFLVVPHSNFNDPDEAYSNASFTAALDDVALAEVAYRARTRLTAVVPAGLSPGPHDLVVRDPDGRTARLPEAFTILGPGPRDGGPDGQALDLGPRDGQPDTPTTDGPKPDKLLLDSKPPDAKPPLDTKPPPDTKPLPDGSPSVLSWKPVSVGATAALWGIWGTSASNVWAVGAQGTILRYNGSAWAKVASNTTSDLFGVWGSSASDVWAVGAGGTILHWTGSSWAGVASGTSKTIQGVWAWSASGAWAVGWNGLVLRYNGATWSEVASGTKKKLNGVRGLNASDVWIAGEGGTILHYNGSAWSTSPNGQQYFQNAISPAAADVWSAGNNSMLHYSNNQWSLYSTYLKNLNGIWHLSSADAWAVGTDGTVLRYNGQSWNELTPLTQDDLNGIWCAASTDCWIVGASGTVFHGTP